MAMQEQVNILLVDDQPAKLLSYEVILADLGENLLKAQSAREALGLLLKNDIAVVLVDVCMPELDGFELAAMLREHPRYEKTAIIFISAVQMSDLDRVRGYETGAVDYVPVPVIPEILRAKVRIFAELARKTRELEALNNELERRVEERTQALEASAARLRLASEAAEFGTYDYNVAAGEIYWSPYLRHMMGISDDTPLTLERALEFIHPEHRQTVRDHIMGYVREGRQELEFKVMRANGDVRWMLDRGQMVTEGTGHNRDRRVMGTIIDVTERRHGEERQRLLMAELDHRVKNILGNVSAMARLSRHRAQSVDGFVKSLDGRIQAMSRAHGLLRQSAWEGANLADLVAETLSPFVTCGASGIVADGPPLRVVPELAQSMSLILHELATNAIKHGALSAPNGCVEISWARVPDGTVRFDWRESGGPPVRAPEMQGFGLTVLQTSASNLKAVAYCDFKEPGFVYTLNGPFELVESRTPIRGGVSDLAIAAPVARPEAQHAGLSDGCRVLIVEDEALVALQLQDELEQDGHLVVGPARSLTQGLLMAANEDIDVALVDVSLGEDTSVAIADKLLARSIPFAFTTGYSDPKMLPEHLRAIPRLAKPYALGEIRNILGRLFDEHDDSQMGSPPALEG